VIEQQQAIYLVEQILQQVTMAPTHRGGHRVNRFDEHSRRAATAGGRDDHRAIKEHLRMIREPE
jgi:hypothetical protein